MPALEIYPLKFRGGLRVGRRGLELEDTLLGIPSDTLFSALVSALALGGEDVAAFLQPFLADPPQAPFLLTSAFPFAGEVRFYPAPLDWTFGLSGAKMHEYGKRIRQVQFISEALFQNLLQGRLLDEWLFPKDKSEPHQKGVALQGGALWLTADEIRSLPKGIRLAADKRHALPYFSVWKRARIPHVTVDRIRQASEIYNTAQIHFQPECGLWFGVQWREPQRLVNPGGTTYQAALRQAIHLLQGFGLGGKRSIGFGGFEILDHYPKMAGFDLPEPTSGEAAFLLSRYHPRAGELPSVLNGERSSYQLVSIGGWSDPQGTGNLLRRRVMMIAEGSRLYFERLPAGDVVDVSPQEAGPLPHPVYRYGMPLAAGWRVQGG